MLVHLGQWEKLGRILAPDKNIYWMSTYTGASFGVQLESSKFDIYVTGRDSKNRSHIGKITLDIEKPNEIISITPEPVLTFGELGAFDENGVSYPFLVKNQNKVYMYYVGWMPTVLTPFQNHIGLAVQNEDGTFSRISRAPILERNNDDCLSIGSCSVLVEDSKWKMWYTSFLRWGRDPTPHKHHYVIKYAESEDGINWERENKVCIDFKSDDEYAICRPSVLKMDEKYHMWYSYRGEKYKIGYASSSNGIDWKRTDNLVGIDVSKSGFDSKSICYAHVFKHKDCLYMLYNGNNYGQEGLGLARLKG